jgi:hypothetical protein
MALDILAQELIIDETTGLQDDDTSVSNSTVTYLLGLDSAGGLSSPQVAFQANFVVASASAGESISSVILSQNSSGTPFSTTVGVNSGIRTVDGNYVWLFRDANNANIVIGVIGTSDVAAEPAETGPLAFSFALVSTSATNADLYTVQYVPLLHPNAADPDDQIDLADKVFASVSGSTTVNFTGQNAPPGKHEFYLLDSSSDASKQILVTGFLAGANAIPNVSTQGFGINNQSINPTEKLQIDFVTGGTLHAGSASQIQYGSHVETIMQAGFTINQITPSTPTARVDITISAFNVQGNEQGSDFYDGSTTTAAPIISIKLTGQSGVAGDITVDGTYDVAGNTDVVVSGLGTNTVTITGLDNITIVDVTTSSPMDRLTITGVDANEGLDVTEVHFQSSTPNAYSEQVGSFINFDDDGPTPTGVDFVRHVDEDAMTGAGDGDGSTGNVDNPDDGDTITGEQDEVSFNQSDLGTTINSGSDAPALFSLASSFAAGTAVKTTSGANIFSNGSQVFWTVSGSEIRGVADAGARTVFVISVNDQDTPDKSDDVFTFDLKDQLDHASAAGELANLLVDITPAFTATDADLDPVSFGTTKVVMQVENDTATFDDQAPSQTLDWVDDGFVTGSLHGKVGADDSASYIIDKYTDLADYTETLSADKKTLTYSKDGTDFFRLVLNDAANGGAGGYTFTVLAPPPQEPLELDFEDLDSGQNLFGTIAFDKTNVDDNGTPGNLLDDFLPGGGLLTFPSNPDIGADGTMTNISGTTNTSKGGGPVTIGNENQAFDHLDEGAWFCYVDDPRAGSVSGVGLNANRADDADNIQFNGTVDVSKASVEIVQASGAGTTKRPGPAMHVEAWDLNPGTVDSDSESRAFLLDPTATGTQVNIIGIKILDATGKVIEYVRDVGTVDGVYVLQDSDDAGTDVTASDNSAVNITWVLDSAGIYSVTASNLKANYTIEWETETLHNAALTQNFAGSYDIGGFNILQGQDSTDVDFEFSVAIEDEDGDGNHFAATNDVFDDFRIRVDGTGVNNDPANDPPTGFVTSYDTPGDYFIVP